MKITNSLIAISITLILFGAKKWDNAIASDGDYESNDAYFLKAKVDGNWIEFNQKNELNANFGPFIDNIYDGVISASKSDAEQLSILNGITILIRHQGKIGLGSYSGGKPFDYGFNGVAISYTDGVNMAMYVTDVNNPQSFLKISEFTDTYIKGTFSGDVINTMNKNKITITDGEFFIKSNSY